MAALTAIAARHSLAIVEDCCQAHLATCAGTPVGTLGAGGAFSFYPTKNLGALGDGGAAVSNDSSIAARVRRLRNGGQINRYLHEDAGVNSRLDELQAAILRTRLPMLPRWTARRRALAASYRRLLTGSVRPLPCRDEGHVYHLFVVRSNERDVLQEHLSASRIETLIHYPIPMTHQPAFKQWTRSDCPRAACAAREILSLPLHQRLADKDVDRVCLGIDAFQKGHTLA
jgi:dTDP-4-amino-4,6-dideoxygalactose transaminase